MQATIKDMDFIFPVPALRSIIYPPCKYGMHGYAQLIHSSLSKSGTIPLNSGNLLVKMSYSEWGSIKRADLQTAYRYSAESFRVESNMIRAIYLCSYKVWPYAGQSQLDAKIEYS